jgi:hypothetical protein
MFDVGVRHSTAGAVVSGAHGHRCLDFLEPLAGPARRKFEVPPTSQAHRSEGPASRPAGPSLVSQLERNLDFGN